MTSCQSFTILLLASILLLLDLRNFSFGFSISSPRVRSRTVIRETAEPQHADASKAESNKLSLEEKMAKWEASEEEIKAATLGGLVPGRADSFDVGLYVAFPLMLMGCLLFLAFPFLADKIDVSSVGPPATS